MQGNLLHWILYLSSISPPSKMESNVSFSTPASSESPIYIDLSLEPFLAKENNSLVNQDTSFHIPDFNASWSFLANQQFTDPSGSAKFGSC